MMEKDQGQPPFISVVIPALNCETDVTDCVAALRAQDYPADRFEILIVDNGSTDGTLERIRESGAQALTRPERGRARALNEGLKYARGDIITTTDISCIARPDWISKVVACFADPQVGCVAGEIKMIRTHDNLALRYQARNDYMSPLHALKRRTLPFLPFADGANASFRRVIFDEIGGFEESFFKAADVEICYRLLVLTDYRIVFCPDCVVEEAGEPDLKALLQQRYRMGMGSNLIRVRFPEFYINGETRKTLKHRYWLAREYLAGLAHFGTALVRGDRSAVEDAIVRYLMGLAQALGARHGLSYLQQQTEQPTPLDSERVKEFMAKMHKLDERVILKRAQHL